MIITKEQFDKARQQARKEAEQRYDQTKNYKTAMINLIDWEVVFDEENKVIYYTATYSKVGQEEVIQVGVKQ